MRKRSAFVGLSQVTLPRRRVGKTVACSTVISNYASVSNNWSRTNPSDAAQSAHRRQSLDAWLYPAKERSAQRVRPGATRQNNWFWMSATNRIIIVGSAPIGGSASGY
jgi:hypothetical protein